MHLSKTLWCSGEGRNGCGKERSHSYAGLLSGRCLLGKGVLRNGDLKISPFKATCALSPLENSHVPVITSV